MTDCGNASASVATEILYPDEYVMASLLNELFLLQPAIYYFPKVGDGKPRCCLFGNQQLEAVLVTFASMEQGKQHRFS
jgi:hypothetical protein